MRRTILLLSTLLLTLAASAQTLNVVTGDITYQFPSVQTGDMTYTDGTTLTICGKAFPISDINSMYVDTTSVTDNEVAVVYNGTSAKVTVAGNVAQYVSPSVSGAHVSIAQTNTADVDSAEISYSLSGTSTDGEFYMSGKYKATIDLRGLSLTNTNPVYSGAALHIQNGKRINISVKKDTENTLTDCATPTSKQAQKGAIYVKGHAEFKGKGVLNIYGLYKHAIKAGEYVSVKNCTLNVKQASGDGINCNRYFLLENGNVNIINVGDDGIQAELDADTDTTTVTPDHEDENTGNLYILDGTATVTATAIAAKCLKADGTVNIAGGTITVNAQGDIDLTGTDAEGNLDPSYAAGIKCTDYLQSGGSVTATVTGAAGRGITADNTFSGTGGTISVTSNAASSSGTTTISDTNYNYFCTAKGIKATKVALDGTDITVTSSGAASKGIKADDGDMTITGGTINVTTTGTGAYDTTESSVKACASISADGNMTISGGTLTLKATDAGGKGISGDGALAISDSAHITVTTSGAIIYYSSNKLTTTTSSETTQRINDALKSSPKGIKVDGNMTISGGTTSATASYHEAIETKGTLNITGGNVYAQSSDDGINSAGVMTISGGNVCSYSTGNDGLDANADCYIKGGNVYAIGASTPEVGIDALEQRTLSITGGNVVAIGGLESGASVSINCQQLGSSGGSSGGGNRPGQGGFGPGGNSGSQSWTANTWYALYNGSSLAFAFKAPSSGGSSLVVCTSGTPALYSSPTVSGVTIWNGMGATNSVSGGTSATLSTYSSGGGR